MQNAERNRLIRDSSGTSANAAGIVIKCSMGLGILTLLALIGSETTGDNVAVPDASHVTRAMAVAPNNVNAAAHRKHVFDERRARFDGSANEYMAMRPAHDHDPANATRPGPKQ